MTNDTEITAPADPIYDMNNMAARSGGSRWEMMECRSLPHPTNNYSAGCALTEGDMTGDNHTHWKDWLTGVEVVVAWHKTGERPMPNCQIRVPGRD